MAVAISTDTLSVRLPQSAAQSAAGSFPPSGRLFAAVKAEESTWLVVDGLLELTLLKRARRGQYGDGRSCADTFWSALFAHGPPEAALSLKYPPTEYYSALHDSPARRFPARRFPGLFCFGDVVRTLCDMV